MSLVMLLTSDCCDSGGSGTVDEDRRAGQSDTTEKQGYRKQR